jgi:predicted DNA-binding ribbon-helix-helix protein
MITADDHIEELLEKYPKINRYMMRRGIICVQCGETFWGTLGELIREKNMNVDEIIAELNSEFAE